MGNSLIESLRQPEYTGENRCKLCTIVNIIIAAVFSVVIARKSKIAGVVSVCVSVGLIYLRGYLIPGTPELTKRHLPPEILRWFGKESEPVVHSGFSKPLDSSRNNNPAGVSKMEEDGDKDEPGLTLTPEAYFLEHDIIEPCSTTDDLCLSDEFEIVWLEEIEQIESDTIDGEDIAKAIDLTATDNFDIERHGEARVLRRGDDAIGQWPSRAAIVADVAAATLLQSKDPKWRSYTSEEKGQLLNSLRLFLESCPTTGGAVSLGKDTVESCCQSRDVIVASCDDTDERLFEYPADEVLS